MAETKQISATINLDTANGIADLAKKENRTFSQMVDILLSQALVISKTVKAKK